MCYVCVCLAVCLSEYVCLSMCVCPCVRVCDKLYTYSKQGKIAGLNFCVFHSFQEYRESFCVILNNEYLYALLMAKVT